MRISMKMMFIQIRRWVLKNFIPEWIWPSFVSIDGVEIQIRNAPYSFGIKRLLTKDPNQYEGPERFFVNAIAPGSKVLELGGSIGVLTSIISKRIGPSGYILSIEASQSLTQFSRLWLEAKMNIRVVNAFAFPIFKRVPLKVVFDESLGSLGGTVEFHSESESIEEENMFFLEDNMIKYQFNPDVLVCDIEGSESIVLSHKPEIPAPIRNIIIELHPSMYGMEKAIQIIQVFRDEGFELIGSLQTVYLFQRALHSKHA